MSAALYLCLHLRDFAAQAMEYAHSELRRRPLALLRGTPPLESVFALNQQARALGVERGMGCLQAESFAGVAIRPRERALEERAFATVIECAGRFSPRIEIIHPSKPTEGFHPNAPTAGVLGAPGLLGARIAAPQENSSDATLVLDIANSSRLLGKPEQIAKTIQREIRIAGFEASIAISRNACAAVLAARGNASITILAAGKEAQTLAPLPLSVLQPDEEQARTLAAWGIRTLGQLAALPSRSLAARLGQSGLSLQTQARGEYDHLLVPAEEPADAPLSAGIELEHPVELLEPLLLWGNHLLQQVLEAAQQRALAIASLELTLIFESRTEEQRTIRPALPERDRLVLLKLMQLELELRPPVSAVLALRLVAHPARPQMAQQGLFAAQAPEPGRMAVLLARLRKLIGEGRVGSPELLDSRAPEAFRMTSFLADAAEDHFVDAGSASHSPALRMLRPPREVAIELCRGAPVAMRCDGQRRTVQASSGPWRTSGEWWTHPGFNPNEPNTGSPGTPGWCREEWDILVRDDMKANETLHEQTLRLAHDPANGGWYVIGIYD